MAAAAACSQADERWDAAARLGRARPEGKGEVMRVRIALLASIAIATTLCGVARAQAARVLSGTEQVVAADPGNQYDPAISGNTVVFTDDRAGDTDVYYVDLATGVEHPVVVAPGNQELTGISGPRIVYTDYRNVDIYVFDTATGIGTNLTGFEKTALGRGYNAFDPSIGDSLVAWEQDASGSMEIAARDLTTGEERSVSGVDPAMVNERPAVGGGWVAWQRCPSAGGACDVYAYDWATGETRLVASGIGGFPNPSTDGIRVVYAGGADPDTDVCAYDLATEATHCLALPGDQMNPHISGDWVSYDSYVNPGYHAGLWYLPTGDAFALDQVAGGPPATANQYLTGVDGNRVVYTDDRNGDLNIYAFTFQLRQSDTTPPTIVVPATVHVNATGPGGAVAGYSVTVTDDTDPAPSLSCAPASGSLFAIGDTTVSCTATDSSGNAATASFAVHVAGAAEQLAALRSHVASLGLRKLVAASLDTELHLAQVALAAGYPKLACASLALFEIEVRVLPPSAINSANAADLVASAKRIRTVLGC